MYLCAFLVSGILLYNTHMDGGNIVEDKRNGNVISPERRARINRMKRNIVIINFTILFTAIFLCILLFIRVMMLSSEVKSLEELLEKNQRIHDYEEQSTQSETETNTETEQKQETIADKADEETADVVESNETVREKVVYLTFDDGPSDNTYAILDILDRYNVKATFFVNGKEGSSYEQTYKEIVRRGNSIGMHSYSHVFGEVYESLESFEKDTERLHDFLYALTGEDVKIYRFPGGSSTTTTKNIKQYINYLDSKGYIYYDWNVSSRDAVSTPLSADAIVNNVMSGVNGKDSAIVLMHDSALKDTTVEALPIIIEKLLNEGYAILPIVNTTPPVHHTVN